jgi:cytochrome P450
MEHSTFATSDDDIHRIRRAPLAKFFTKTQIARLEPLIHTLAQRFCDKLLAQTGTNKPFDLTMAYSCFTADAISEYCFGESFGFLGQADWEPNYRTPLYALLRTIYVFRFFPILKEVTVKVPW